MKNVTKLIVVSAVALFATSCAKLPCTPSCMKEFAEVNDVNEYVNDVNEFDGPVK